jgi:hypothetical protein
MKKEVDVATVLDMKRPDYKKLFKKMALWKKTRGIIVLVDYKLDGKKTSLAVPFKKKPIMLKELKKIKSDKLHLLKKTGMCHFELSKKPKGGWLAKIELIKGGLSADLLQAKMRPLFGSIDIDIEVVGTENTSNTETSDDAQDSNPVVSRLDHQKSLIKLTNQSFLYVRDFLLPNYKLGRLDSEELLELDNHEAIFVQFMTGFEGENMPDTVLKLKLAIQKIQPQCTKIRSALEGTNSELAQEFMHNKLKNLATAIEKRTKKIKKTVVRNLKKLKTKPRDIEVLEEVLELIGEFEFNFDAASDLIQQKLVKLAQKLQQKLKPKLNDLYNRVVDSSPQKISASTEQERLKLRYATIDDNVKEMKLQIEALLEQVAAEEKDKPKETALPEGEDFLNNLS